MLLQANNIRKEYSGTAILEQVTLELRRGDRIGLVGVNGAGKSTFLQILAGEMSATAGDLIKPKETSIGYLPQHTTLDSPRSIWEELKTVYEDLIDMEKSLRDLEQAMAEPDVLQDEHKYEAVLNEYSGKSELFKARGGYEYESNMRKVLHGIGLGALDAHTPVAQLSGGQKTRLALAKLLLTSPDILLLDEPTNHLDIEALTWLENYLRNYRGAIVLISHDRYFLDALVTQIVEISRGRSVHYTGNYSRYTVMKSEAYERERKQYEKQRQEIAKMEQFIQKNIARASTTKRAQSRRKALEKIERLDAPSAGTRTAHIQFESGRRSGNDVLTVENVAVAYGEAPLLQNVAFEMKRGDRLAIIGPNGIGKSSLLKTLCDRIPAAGGEYRWGSNVSIGFYDQEQADLHPDKTVLHEVWDAYPHLEEQRVRTVLGAYLFSGDDVLKKIASLSGGEKARVALAKLMLLDANVLVLDEPTNHLDLQSREVLESALANYDGTILFISHDRYFLNKIANRIVELFPDHVDHFLGNYDDYVEKKKELQQIESEADNPPAFALTAHRQNSYVTSKQHTQTADNTKVQSNHDGALSYEEEKRAKQQERNRQRKLAQLEEEIASIEQEIVELETQLTLPDVYEDYTAVQNINETIDEKKQLLDEKYAEWDQLLT